jgi:glucosyl-3-phosphoglycerate synthase
MSDFYQTGVVATLHRLGHRRIEEIEDELVRHSRHMPMTLVLPALYGEFETPAMAGILKELPKIPYLTQIVLSLGNATEEQFADARHRLEGVHKNVRVIWIEGERVQRLLRELEENDLSAGPPGKGRACWLAYGYVLASAQAKVIGLHDCDIVNYNREMVARLMYPMVHPTLDFEFCKGYYARYTGKLHGRVTRLFITPFVRTLQQIFGYLPFLVYFDSFRYPLAGEFSMHAELARSNRIPADWGLEVGVLAEIYRNCGLGGQLRAQAPGALRRRSQERLDANGHRHRQGDVPHGGRRRRRAVRRHLPHHPHQVCAHGRGHHHPLLRRCLDQRVGA